MKKLLFVFVLLTVSFSLSSYPLLPSPVSIPMQVERVPIKIGTGGPQRSPMQVLPISFDGNTLYFPENYQESVFQICQDGEEIYSLYVPTGMTQIELPSDLEGEYEISFTKGDYYYYGYIEFL